jgi:SAM-dependent methyltransferase
VAVRDIYVNGEYRRLHPTWHEEDAAWKADNITALLRRNGIAPQSWCEIGCGAGGILRHLAARFPTSETFVGFDVSPDAIALCTSQENDPRISFRLADALAHEETYDVVLAIDVFEHVDDYLGFLQRVAGKGRMTVFHIPLDLYAFGLLHTGALRSAREINGHLHHFTRETALDTLRYTGFTPRDHMLTRSFDLAPLNSLRNRLAHATRSMMFRVTPERTARWLGGVSLLVLASHD